MKFDVERFGINENGFSKLHVLDAKSLKPVALPKLRQADFTSLGGVSRNGRYATFVVSGAQLPATLVVWRSSATARRRAARA